MPRNVYNRPVAYETDMATADGLPVQNAAKTDAGPE